MSWKKENKTSRNLSRNQLFIIMLPYQNVKQKPSVDCSFHIAHSHSSNTDFMLETDVKVNLS